MNNLELNIENERPRLQRSVENRESTREYRPPSQGRPSDTRTQLPWAGDARDVLSELPRSTRSPYDAQPIQTCRHANCTKIADETTQGYCWQHHKEFASYNASPMPRAQGHNNRSQQRARSGMLHLYNDSEYRDATRSERSERASREPQRVRFVDRSDSTIHEEVSENESQSPGVHNNGRNLGYGSNGARQVRTQNQSYSPPEYNASSAVSDWSFPVGPTDLSGSMSSSLHIARPPSNDSVLYNSRPPNEVYPYIRSQGEVSNNTYHPSVSTHGNMSIITHPTDIQAAQQGHLIKRLQQQESLSTFDPHRPRDFDNEEVIESCPSSSSNDSIPKMCRQCGRSPQVNGPRGLCNQCKDREMADVPLPLPVFVTGQNHHSVPRYSPPHITRGPRSEVLSLQPTGYRGSPRDQIHHNFQVRRLEVTRHNRDFHAESSNEELASMQPVQDRDNQVYIPALSLSESRLPSLAYFGHLYRSHALDSLVESSDAGADPGFS